MVELIDEADVAAPQRGARSSVMAEVGWPAIDLAGVGRSSRPARCSSVDLPAPEGAISATDSPARAPASAVSTSTMVSPRP